jgi:voltage-dependent potassium channel beta subunit
MTYRRLGASGLSVSTIGLGSWLTFGASVDDETAIACVRAALESGVIFFDTADVYNRGEAERLLGKALAGEKRSEIVLATKAYFPMSDKPNDRGLSRKHLLESIHASLKRLRVDHVDLYQCHRFDPHTPIDETVRAMDDLVRQGKILYWGVSCWDEEQIAEAVQIADATNAAAPISNQPPYNMLERGIEDGLLAACRDLGLGQVVFSPLAEGLLSGKYAGGEIPEGSRAAGERIGQFLRPKMTDRNHKRVERLAGLAARAGLTLPQMALAWTLRDDAVASAIVGASRPEQIRENVKAAGVTLGVDLLREIEMVLSGS